MQFIHLEVIQGDPALKNQFGNKRTSLPNAFKTVEKDTARDQFSSNNHNTSGMSLATQLGKLEYYQPKLSRKPNLKDSLPSYKQSQIGLFCDNEMKNRVKVDYKRKVGKGIDLSDVMNESYLPERDISKINNSVINPHDRNEVYMSPNKVNKLIKRNIDVSHTNNFLKTYDGSLNDFLKEQQAKENNANLQNRVTGSYDFTQESLENQANSKDMQSSWLDGRTKKKQIGPNKNNSSSEFTLAAMLAAQNSRNRLYQRHSISHIRKLAQNEVAGDRYKGYLEKVEVNKKLLLDAAKKLIGENSEAQHHSKTKIKKVNKTKLAHKNLKKKVKK